MEDFVNYMKPSMFLITCKCDWKCCIEASIPKEICQNEPLIKQPINEFSNKAIYDAYISNKITGAVCIGGLEPMLQIDEVIDLINYFRQNGCEDEFVIYTGYYKDELSDIISRLIKYPNIIIKFGRYIPNRKTVYDNILGVELASDNQYAEKIS